MFPMFPIDTASLGYTLEKKKHFWETPNADIQE
jgi:hypothetical protein